MIHLALWIASAVIVGFAAVVATMISGWIISGWAHQIRVAFIGAEPDAEK